MPQGITPDRFSQRVENFQVKTPSVKDDFVTLKGGNRLSSRRRIINSNEALFRNRVEMQNLKVFWRESREIPRNRRESM